MTPKRFAKIHKRAVIVSIICLVIFFLIMVILEVRGQLQIHPALVLLPAMVVIGVVNVVTILACWRCHSCRKALPLCGNYAPGFSPDLSITHCPNCNVEIE